MSFICIYGANALIILYPLLYEASRSTCGPVACSTSTSSSSGKDVPQGSATWGGPCGFPGWFVMALTVQSFKNSTRGCIYAVSKHMEAYVMVTSKGACSERLAFVCAHVSVSGLGHRPYVMHVCNARARATQFWPTRPTWYHMPLSVSTCWRQHLMYSLCWWHGRSWAPDELMNQQLRVDFSLWPASGAPRVRAPCNSCCCVMNNWSACEALAGMYGAKARITGLG